MQMAIPWATTLDVEWVGQHSYNTVRTVNINTVDFGSAFLPQNQDPTWSARRPGGAAVSTDLMRVVPGLRRRSTSGMFDGWRTFHSLQMSLNRRFRNGVSFGFNDTWVLYDHAIAGARAAARRRRLLSRSATIRTQANELLGTFIPNRHIFKGNFVWDLPDLHGERRRDEGRRLDRQRLAALGRLDRSTTARPTRQAAPTTSATRYTTGGGNVNITGSPDYARPRPHRRRPRQRLQQRPLPAVQRRGVPGPADNSVGLESRRRLPARLLPERCSTWPSPGTSGSAAAATCSSASRCSTRRTAPSSPAQHHHEAGEPHRPGDDHQPALRRGRQLIPARAIPSGAGFGVATVYQNPARFRPRCGSRSKLRKGWDVRPAPSRRLWARCELSCLPPSCSPLLVTSRSPERRRATAALALAAVSALLLPACSTRPAPAPVVAAAARNVLIVTIDTLRADRVGVYGATQVETPNIDRLAREGAWAPQATVPAPLTRPSHVSLFTGLYPAEHGIRDNIAPPLRAEVPVLAEILKRRGFSTGAFVASVVLDRQAGLARGFDVYSDRFGPDVDRKGGDVVVSEAIEWLAGKDRFLAWVHLYDVHAPVRAAAGLRRPLRRPAVRRRGRVERRACRPLDRSAADDRPS